MWGAVAACPQPDPVVNDEGRSPTLAWWRWAVQMR